MTKDVDTDLSEIFRAMHDSYDPTVGDHPPAPMITPLVLKGGRQKRTIVPVAMILAILGIALLCVMLFHR